MPEYPWVSVDPYEMGDKRAPVACLFVHGFAGTPSETRLLAEAMSDDYFCVGLRLLGHGVEPEALRSVEWEDWEAQVLAAYLELKREHESVFILGLSMGSLLACLVETKLSQSQKPAGLILMAPALKARDERLKFAPILKYVLPSFPEAHRVKAGLTNPDGWKSLWHYEKRPVHSLAELYFIQQAAAKIMSKVKTPTLIFHGLKDQTVPESSARDVLELLGSESKELVWLEHSGHCLTADVELDVVARESKRFIQDLVQ